MHGILVSILCGYLMDYRFLVLRFIFVFASTLELGYVLMSLTIELTHDDLLPIVAIIIISFALGSDWFWLWLIPSFIYSGDYVLILEVWRSMIALFCYEVFLAAYAEFTHSVFFTVLVVVEVRTYVSVGVSQLILLYLSGVERLEGLSLAHVADCLVFGTNGHNDVWIKHILYGLGLL